MRALLVALLLVGGGLTAEVAVPVPKELVKERMQAMMKARRSGRAVHPQEFSREAMDSCVDFKGEQLCPESQNRWTESRCPEIFYEAHLRYCGLLAHILDNYDTVESIEARWWTNRNCTIHRTLCLIHQETHDQQYEVDTYDFSGACQKRIGIEYKYSYQGKNSSSQHSAEYNGHFLIYEGGYHTVWRFEDHSDGSLYEELVAIYLYERDAKGEVTYLDNEIQEPPSPSILYRGSKEGLWAQFRYRTRKRESLQAPIVTRNYEYLEYHVSYNRAVSQCTERKGYVQYAATESEVLSPGAIAGICIASVAACLFAIFGVHQIRKNSKLQRQIAALTPAHIEVAEVQPGHVVRGVVIETPGRGECEAAPLPPSTTTTCPEC